MNRGDYSPQPTSGTIDGAPSIQTPSPVENGLGGGLFLSKHNTCKKVEGSQWRGRKTGGAVSAGR